MTPEDIARAVTDFGDQGLVLPMVVLVGLALFLLGDRRSAFWWALALATALGLAFVAKLIFIPCGRFVPELQVQSPSGHMAAAAALYGSLAILAARMIAASGRDTLAVRSLGIGLVGLAALGAGAIGVTRVMLGAHTPAETVLGAAIGIAAPAILGLVDHRPTLKPGPKLLWLLLAAVALVVLIHGAHVSVESRITGLAWFLSKSTGVCWAR